MYSNNDRLWFINNEIQSVKLNPYYGYHLNNMYNPRAMENNMSDYYVAQWNLWLTDNLFIVNHFITS